MNREPIVPNFESITFDYFKVSLVDCHHYVSEQASDPDRPVFVGLNKTFRVLLQGSQHSNFNYGA